jgi:antitoxin MazE
MRSQVQKWGNNLALRLPRRVTADLGLRERSAVELTLKDGAVEVRPIDTKASRLEKLLAGVSEQKLHGEWETDGLGCVRQSHSACERLRPARRRVALHRQYLHIACFGRLASLGLARSRHAKPIVVHSLVEREPW